MCNRLWTRSWSSALTAPTDSGTNTATLPETRAFARSALPFTVPPTSNRLVATWLDRPDTVTAPLLALQPHPLLLAPADTEVLRREPSEAVHLAKDRRREARALAELATPDHRDHQDKTATMATTDLQARMEITDLTLQPDNSHLLPISASTAHQDPLDPPETPDPRAHQDQTETMDSQEALEETLHQDHQDQPDHQDNQETQDKPDLPDNQDRFKTFQDSPGPPDQLDLQDLQDQTDSQEAQEAANPDRQALQETLDHQDHLETLELLDSQAATEKPDLEAVATTAHHRAQRPDIKLLGDHRDLDAIQTVSFVPNVPKTNVFPYLLSPFLLICNFIRHPKTRKK